MDITVVWPSGQVTRGSGWREVEDAIRAQQWRDYPTRHAFRADMRKRVRVWTGHPAKNAFGTSKQFITALAESGMILLAVADGTDTKGRVEK